MTRIRMDSMRWAGRCSRRGTAHLTHSRDRSISTFILCDFSTRCTQRSRWTHEPGAQGLNRGFD